MISPDIIGCGVTSCDVMSITGVYAYRHAQVVVSSSQASNKRTLLVTFAPKYILINNTATELVIEERAKGESCQMIVAVVLL